MSVKASEVCKITKNTRGKCVLAYSYVSTKVCTFSVLPEKKTALKITPFGRLIPHPSS
jgi:hypothetical protein